MGSSTDPVGLLVYDVTAGAFVADISDYLHHLLESRRLTFTTVHQGAYHLVEFWRFLAASNLDLRRISDNALRRFRDDNFSKVKASRSHRGDSRKSRATVNLKLSRIYDWLIWLQEQGRLSVGTIGMRGLVTALLEEPRAHRHKNGGWRSTGGKYPLRFRDARQNAKHNAPLEIVSESHVDAISGLMMARHQEFVARRNQLFIDIADASGMRRGSICSLDVRQFGIEALRGASGEFLVRPSRQKFGYGKILPISLTLAYRVADFIESCWKPRVAEKAIAATTHKYALFISARDGSPITERAMTQAISKGFRALGFPKGVGPHRLRSKFTSETVDDELAERLELGLDTSIMSIAAAVAVKLGHDDPSQFYRYAASSQSRKARIVREGRLSELNALRAKVEELERELARGHGHHPRTTGG